MELTGNLTVQLKDEFGNIKDERCVDNLVVTTGRNFVAARMVQNDPLMTHMGLGTESTTPIAANTDVGTPIGTRAAFDVTPTATDNVSTFTATFDPGNGTGAITEAGIFDAVTGGNMLSHTTFAVVNKAADDTLTIIWNITVN